MHRIFYCDMLEGCAIVFRAIHCFNLMMVMMMMISYYWLSGVVVRSRNGDPLGPLSLTLSKLFIRVMLRPTQPSIPPG